MSRHVILLTDAHEAPAYELIEALRGAGLVVHTAVCVVDREEGGADALAREAVRLRPLFRVSELLAHAK